MFLIFGLWLTIILISCYYLIKYKYPPGPWGLPILGHLHLLGDYPHKTLMDMKSKFGSIIACDFGSFRGVVLNDYEVIKEALNDTAFTGRPKLRAFYERTGGKIRGVIFTEGHEWMEQRRFTLRHLRDFGFGKMSQEGLIKDEVDELIVNLKKNVGIPISTRNLFSTAVLNALWTMMTGERHSQDDSKVQQILQLMTESMADPSPAALFMPWLTKLFPEWSGWNAFMRDIKPSNDFLKIFIEEHRKTITRNEPRDFTDAYLDEIANEINQDSTFYREIGDSSLQATLLDLFFASTETTGHTLAWAILYLSLPENLEAQQNVFKEIAEVVGLTRAPNISDRPNLPYTEATIMETMRLSSLVPLGVFHSTIRDTEFHGYKIPKDTMVLTNLYAVLHDPLLWENPEEFHPERFLSKDKTKIIKPESFIPFSIGKRICIGESLAKDEIFLIISNILQLFTVSLDPNSTRPSLLPVSGPVSSPKPHKIVFNAR